LIRISGQSFQLGGITALKAQTGLFVSTIGIKREGFIGQLFDIAFLDAGSVS